MILFIADYPTEQNIRDGMMQRIAAIDSLVSDVERVYLNVSFKRNLRKTSVLIGNCRVENVNFFIHYKLIVSEIKRAKFIYCHSIINLFKILPVIDFSKLLLDVHGVVPEEHKFMGKGIYYHLFNIAERAAIKKAYKIIHVTKAMERHFEKKYQYKNIADRSLIFPIFESVAVNRNELKWEKGEFYCVYAGGTQAWQNISMMMGLIQKKNKRGNEYYSVFLPEKQVLIFEQEYSKIIDDADVNIGSLSKEQVIDVLKESHLGFILRDDILVNRVACPTKLIEYLECGVIPIIHQENIGDFATLGYQYLTKEEFLAGDYDSVSLKNKADINYGVMEEYKKMTLLAREKIIEILHA